MTPKPLWPKVATPIAVAVTAASENLLKGRIEPTVGDM
jgi:hypothetical protein